MVLVQGGGKGFRPRLQTRSRATHHEARGSGAGPSRACCRKPLMNSRSSTAMPSSDAASSGAPDDASSAESESDTDTVDTAARAGGRGAGAVARGARGRRAGSSIVANDSTAGSREEGERCWFGRDDRRAGHGQAPAEAVVLGERGRQLLLQGRDEVPLLLPVPRRAEPVPLHARALARLALLHDRAVAFLAHCCCFRRSTSGWCARMRDSAPFSKRRGG